MEAWLSWSLVLALAGIVYVYYTQNAKGGASRGRTMQRSGSNDLSWSDSDNKTKPSGKAAKKAKAPRKSVKKAVQEVGDKAASYVSAASNVSANAEVDTLPAVGEKLAAVVPSGRDVSDMLDTKTAPNILKIGASEKPARPGKPQQQRSEPSVETKKQRQNKRKNEEAKAAREAAEEDRKKLLEKQRRAAREARGEPAKNGVAPANAWNRASAQSTLGQAAPVNGQLLDTIDNVSTASSSEAATNGTAPTPDSTSYANLPSEEDQLRQAIEDSNWTTVEKGKKAKKSAAEEGSDSGAVQEPAPIPVKAPSKPAPVKKENAKPLVASRFEVLSNTTSVGHPLDSDWPVV